MTKCKTCNQEPNYCPDCGMPLMTRRTILKSMMKHEQTECVWGGIDEQ